MNVIEEIKNDISGAAALADWLGDSGEPVSRMVAEFRSHRCVFGDEGSPCPKNTAPNWWDKVKHKIADWIRKELELKAQMSLEVSHEQDLHMCKACGCCLRLKVWTPRVHLAKHTTQKQLAEMPNYCWLKMELS